MTETPKTIREFFKERLESKLKESGPDIPDRLLVMSEEPIEDFDLFVGRQKELRDMADALASALKGNYRRIILIGEPGSGKSSMLYVVSTAYSSSGHQSRYLILPFEKRHYYEKNWEKTYSLGIMFELINEAERHLKKLSREDKRIDKLNEFRSKMMNALDKVNSVADIQKLAKKTGVCKQDENLQKFITGCFKQQKLVFVFDDAQVLIENKSLFKEILDFVRSLDAIAVFSIYPKTYISLLNEKHELLKDAMPISLGPFSIDDAKELLRRRLLIAVEKRNKIYSPPDYITELFPFQEAAVEFIARKEANPLHFIQALKRADEKAKELNRDIITLEVATKIYSHEKETTINLAPKSKSVFEFVVNKGPVTIDDVKKFLKVSRIGAFLHLKKLVKLGLIAIEKRGRKNYYRVPESRRFTLNETILADDKIVTSAIERDNTS